MSSSPKADQAKIKSENDLDQIDDSDLDAVSGGEEAEAENK
jgi:hypothetical protein